jgi:predicted metal-dependent peptidase
MAESGGFDEHDWEGAQSLSDEDKRELARDIDEAIRQGAMAAGKMGGTGNRDLDELLQPQVDWREVLREFIQNTCAGNDYSTYARPNRRLMSQGIIMPSGISEQVGELVIAIDTSGSIGQRELTAFLSEVKGVCDTVKPDKLRLLYWGSSVVGDEAYDMRELDNLVKSTKPMGGGGTDVNCVTQYMIDESIKPQACIVLTDGYLYSGWGDWTCPILWAILDNKGAVPDEGKAVHIKSRDM